MTKTNFLNKLTQHWSHSHPISSIFNFSEVTTSVTTNAHLKSLLRLEVTEVCATQDETIE